MLLLVPSLNSRGLGFSERELQRRGGEVFVRTQQVERRAEQAAEEEEDCGHPSGDAQGTHAASAAGGSAGSGSAVAASAAAVNTGEGVSA